jgi:aldose 1-epimerase
MFTIHTKQEDGFEIIVLNDNASQTSVEIIPSCGAILHAFKIKLEDGVLNVIDSYSNKNEFENKAEEKGFRGCKLSPFVCRLKEGKYNFGEKDYTIEKFYLGRHALHGLIYDAHFEIIQLNATTTSARAELLFNYKRADKGFPFKYECRVIYELNNNHALHISTIIKNKESHAIPIVDGWHPYFTFGGSVNDLYMSFKSKGMFEFDEELIPTKNILPYTEFNNMKQIGETRLDNGFLAEVNSREPVLILKDAEKKLQLEIRPDKSYPVLQIYTPDHRQSIAIENLSGAPDSFNNEIGLTLLQGGREAVFNTSYVLRATD